MPSLIDPKTCVPLDVVRKFSIVEENRSWLAGELLIAGFTNILIESSMGTQSGLVYRVEGAIYFVFPWAHRYVLDYMRSSGLPHMPSDEQEITDLAVTHGYACTWSKHNREDWGWRIYPDERSSPMGHPALAMGIRWFPAQCLPAGVDIPVVRGCRARVRPG